MRAIGLRCEHREDVPCVDHSAPRFSWALDGGTRQTAYRIRVAELWDSGRIATSQSVDVEYAGPALPPGAELEWTVEVWEGDRSQRPRALPHRPRRVDRRLDRARCHP